MDVVKACYLLDLGYGPERLFMFLSYPLFIRGEHVFRIFDCELYKLFLLTDPRHDNG